jgi:hypothetical protein
MKSNEAPFRPWRLLALLVAPLLALMFAQTAFAVPGEADGSAAPSAQATADGNSLTQLKVIVGQVVLSEDACGTNTPACTVDIVKPSPAATVRQADLFCATVPFGYVPDNDDVTLNGVPVAWDQVLAYMFPFGTGHNTRADVTAIVKPVGDAAPPGVVMFTITENPTFQYDGCALKVIWDDPTTTTNSILIFWGHQETVGDTFVISFAPLTPAAFATPLEFSLGISFGFQPSDQFSQVDVNNVRMTTSAGGQDDGEPANGALITLGGTGDTAANPPAFAPPLTPNVPDDELYDLRPFVMPGDTSVTIFTLNPSNDDNIFLANLFLRNVEVVTPEPPCPPDDDDDDDGLNNNNENLLLTLLDDADSDDDGIKDGNDDENGNGEDDEDEDDDDECPDEDEDDDGVDDEDEDDD